MIAAFFMPWGEKKAKVSLRPLNSDQLIDFQKH
jgi:hypothetical protein